MPLVRVATAFDRVLAVVAVLVTGGLVVASWHDISQGYDIWYYHLPFAARLVGIIDPSTYTFSDANAARFSGFPLLAELLQGIVWRITGRIEATSFVALVPLLAIPVFLRRVFGAPLHLALLALLAIPLVHIHATSSYVDLPANAFVTMLLLWVWRAASTDAPPSVRIVIGSLALGAAAANTKFQLAPIVVLALAALFVIALRAAQGRRARARIVLVFALAAPVVAATPLKNVIVHGNPVWPVELSVLGHAFPFRERAYAQSPPQLEHASRPTRFLRSVLEIDNRSIASQRRWSLDQWAPPDDPSCRMGGYFGAYVVVNLAALLLSIWRRRDRETRMAGIVFGAVTATCALVPQSHELRYYMHWMLLLVAMNVAIWARQARFACGVVVASAFAVVVWSTSAGYLYPSGSTFADFRAHRVDRSVITAAAPGERICVSREPFTFLYAAVFDPRKDYAVREATTDEVCGPPRP